MIGDLDISTLQQIWWLIVSVVGSIFLFLTFVPAHDYSDLVQFYLIIARHNALAFNPLLASASQLAIVSYLASASQGVVLANVSSFNYQTSCLFHILARLSSLLYGIASSPSKGSSILPDSHMLAFNPQLASQHSPSSLMQPLIN